MQCTYILYCFGNDSEKVQAVKRLHDLVGVNNRFGSKSQQMREKHVNKLLSNSFTYFIGNIRCYYGFKKYHYYFFSIMLHYYIGYLNQ